MSASRPLLLAIGVAAVLALIPLTVAAQDAAPSQPAKSPPVAHQAADAPRPQKPGAPVNATAGKAQPAPQGVDPRAVRPAQAFPPERIEAPSAEADAAKPAPDLQSDPRSQEERKDPGG